MYFFDVSVLQIYSVGNCDDMKRSRAHTQAEVSELQVTGPFSLGQHITLTQVAKFKM